jgi:hypothetical protein
LVICPIPDYRLRSTVYSPCPWFLVLLDLDLSLALSQPQPADLARQYLVLCPRLPSTAFSIFVLTRLAAGGKRMAAAALTAVQRSVSSGVARPVSKKKPSLALVPAGFVEKHIYLLRGQRVMLSTDLARLYGVEQKRLNEQVSRNSDRFPVDFMFRLNKREFDNLKSHFATSSWGGLRKPPYAFTVMTLGPARWTSRALPCCPVCSAASRPCR